MGEYVNSRTLRVDKSLVSCGVLEAHHIPKDVNGAVMTLATTLYHKANPRPAAFIIWSDVARITSRGQKLYEKIKELRVGDIYASPSAQNPRTGNMIIVYTFTPNHEKFRKWYEEAVLHYVAHETNDDD